MMVCKLNTFEYDIAEDIIYFHGANRQYNTSISEDLIILDLDDDESIIGIEILDASNQLNISKEDLADTLKFEENYNAAKELVYTVFEPDE